MHCGAAMQMKSVVAISFNNSNNHKCDWIYGNRSKEVTR